MIRYAIRRTGGGMPPMWYVTDGIWARQIEVAHKFDLFAEADMERMRLEQLQSPPCAYDIQKYFIIEEHRDTPEEAYDRAMGVL